MLAVALVLSIKGAVDMVMHIFLQARVVYVCMYMQLALGCSHHFFLHKCHLYMCQVTYITGPGTVLLMHAILHNDAHYENGSSLFKTSGVAYLCSNRHVPQHRTHLSGLIQCLGVLYVGNFPKGFSLINGGCNNARRKTGLLQQTAQTVSQSLPCSPSVGILPLTPVELWFRYSKEYFEPIALTAQIAPMLCRVCQVVEASQHNCR